ncbi:MAG TPA: hypothetical protein PLM75_08600, partial [bacterium]|nr:hypothetical protein [bacterium]
MEILLNFIIGVLSNLFVIYLVYLFSKYFVKKTLQKYVFEFLGIATINESFKNAVGKLLIRKEELQKLNEFLINVKSEAELKKNMALIKSEIISNYKDIDSITVDFQRAQDSFDNILKTKR